MKKGQLIVISGPSGSGKGTVTDILKSTGLFSVSVSATTRKPRPGEVDGVTYHYISKEDFEERIRQNRLLEYNNYNGYYYGTPAEIVDEVENGKRVILEIDVNGGDQVKRFYPQTIRIMLVATSFSEQERRLRGRKSETDEVIQARLQTTHDELLRLSDYDYLVVNREDPHDCAQDIIDLLDGKVTDGRFDASRHMDLLTTYFEH